jgi:hypothetical protein
MYCMDRMTRQIFELHSFTGEGGLQLEKEVRTISMGFADLTPDRIPTHRGDVRTTPHHPHPHPFHPSSHATAQFNALEAAASRRSAVCVA